jgi:hypothetical protein
MSSGNRCGVVARAIGLSSALAIGLLSAPALALVPRHDEDLDRRVVPPVLFDQIAADEVAAGPAAAAAADFRRRRGGEWRLIFDRRTGRVSLAEGSGIPFLPGSGNGLKAADLGLPGPPGGLPDVEALGRAFIAREASLLGPPEGDLILNAERSAFLENGDIVFLDYDWIVEGVPVEGGRVFLRVNHGNIVQFGSARVGAGVPAARPILDAEQAIDRLFGYAGGRKAGDVVVDPPRLLFLVRPRGQPDGPWAEGVTYRLAWRAASRRAGEHMTWTGDVDARTGEILAFADANRYARVVGGVHPRRASDPEEIRPFTNVRVFSSTASFDTGDAGTFPYAGGPAFTPLDGTYVRTTCAACDAPERAFAFVSSGTGDLDLGTGGADQIGNGSSTPAERDSFFHHNRVRSLARKWLNIGWLNTTVQTNVNIDDTCNAFWNGTTTNFFRSSAACNNTGTIADVIYHEWGHGLDQNTNLGDGSTGEATGDITSMHVVHDALVGPSFGVNGSPVRDLDSARVGYVASPANLSGFCIVCLPGQCTNGPYGHEVHCEGEIYGQAQWDLAQALAEKHGFNTGWQVLERIYFLSLPQTDTMVPSQSQNAYSAYLAVDDDNGNLADGTPNCNEIYGAFSTHGIAGAACAGNTAGCVRPAQPALTVTPGSGRVILDWTASPGASAYTVLRADFSAAHAYLPLGGLAGAHFEDVTVQPGVAYYYVVEAQTASGCRSTIENAAAASPLQEGRLTLGAPILSDIPAGNRSGFADPGESIDLTLPLVNQLPSGAAPAAQGTLSAAAANVTVTTATASYGAIAPGASASGTAYRAALGSALACGQDLAFTATLSDGGTAPATTAHVPVVIGQRSTVRYAQDFEGVHDWTVVPGSPAATAGAWIAGDPAGTNWQPNQDATPGLATRCLFTGQNTSDAGGDVDGGETIALSPVIDLSGAVSARLSYRRWWAHSSLADITDGLVVEVSSNGGSSWVVAESLQAAARNLGWQPVDLRIESLVPLTSTFRMRVRARDEGITDTIVEAAIDDVRVEEVVCDLTPPCFVPPTFAGLSSATPGASCGETDLQWSPASTNCQNAQISYSIYRSTAPGLVPGDGNRIAAGLAGTSFHDTLLQPGATYSYVVRADDSRSGQDANTVERAAVATVTPDTVPPVFSGLVSAGTGLACGETVLQWLPAAETCSGPPHYNIYRSTTPGFTPGPGNHVATVLGTAYVDTALAPGQTYYYKARAADSLGNEDGNLLERGAPARVLPLVLYSQDFEAGAGGWATVAPNDAVTGRWELGDPEGTGVQPEDDATPPPGVNAWITGLLAGSALGSFDVDAGRTTVASPVIDLTGQPGPVLQMSLFFSNSQGNLPGEDPLRVEVSGNGGASWTLAFDTLSDIAAWSVRQFPLAGLVPINDQFRVRVQTEDLGAGGSLVEAGVDDVSIFQPGAGCSVCPLPVGGVGTIFVARAGDDVVLDWSADPVAAASYNVYLRSGPTLATWRRAGSTTTKSFVHPGAALLTGDNFVYQVTAVDACGQESPVP